MRFFLLFLLFPLSSFSAIKDYPVTQGKFDYNYSEYSPDTGYWSAPFFTSTDISTSQAFSCYKGTYQFPASTFSGISYIGLPDRKGGRYISLKYTNVTCIVDWVEDKDTYSSTDKVNSVVVQYNYTAFYCPNEKVYSENSLNKTYGCPTIEGGSLENYCQSQPVLKSYSFSPVIKDSSGTYVANYEGCKYEATNITVVVGDRVSSDWRPVGVADPNYGDSIGTPSDNNGGNEGGSEGGNEGGGNEGGNGNNGGNEGGSGNGEYSQVLDKINKNTNNISDSTNRIDETLSNVDDYLKVESKSDGDWREIFDRHFQISSKQLTLNENLARDAHDYTLYGDIIDSISTRRDPIGISDIPNWKDQLLALDRHLPEGNRLIDITQSIDRYSNGGATIDYGTDFKSYHNYTTSLFGMDSLSFSLSQIIPHYIECSPIYIFQGLPYEVVIDCGVINKIKSLLYYVFMFFTLWFVFVTLINALKPQPKES